jgi:hypothetical protein
MASYITKEWLDAEFVPRENGGWHRVLSYPLRLNVNLNPVTVELEDIESSEYGVRLFNVNTQEKILQLISILENGR